MSTDDWWRDAVLYQIYPRSYADSDGDGVGDLQGIRDRLDHLEWLGVDAVWLSPFFPSPDADNGYDVSDYTAVDPVYGTLDDLDALVDDLRRRGIRLLIDQVYNHTSDEHAWFEASRSSVDDPRRDWYVWRPPRPGHEPGTPGAEPNNWISFFGGPAWTFDPSSGEYYLHLFHRKQPDLNWEHPEVRAAIHETMGWWLDRGIAGFRLDVINFISKPPGLPDAAGSGALDARDTLPVVANGPRLVEFLTELRAEASAGRAVRPVLVGEVPGATIEAARAMTDPRAAALDMVIPFAHIQKGPKWERPELSPTHVTGTLARWQDGLADDGWIALYLNNHDQPRSVSRFGDDGALRTRSAMTLATVLHLHRGMPIVYQGEEIAMANRPIADVDDVFDVESAQFVSGAAERGWDADRVLDALRRVSRDHGRVPMQWDHGDHGGFTSGTPWMPASPDHVEWNVAAQMNEPSSVLRHYRALIALRHREPTIRRGAYEPLVADHAQLYAFARVLGDRRIVVAANLSNRAVELPDDLDLGGVDLLPEAGEHDRLERRLQPWECRVRATGPGPSDPS